MLRDNLKHVDSIPPNFIMQKNLKSLLVNIQKSVEEEMRRVLNRRLMKNE